MWNFNEQIREQGREREKKAQLKDFFPLVWEI